QAHPEWFERDRDGQPRRHGESTWLFKTCMFSPYFTDQMPAIYREIAGRYAVDAFFTNGWPSTGALGVCYCESCQKVYREQVGGVPPERTDATSALYRRYYAVFMDRLLEVWRLWDAVARGMVPWFHWLGGSPEDQRWRDTGREFFSWLAAHEPHFRNTRSVADLAVLFPQSTIAFWRASDRAQGTDYLQGLYAALLQGRCMFDFVHESDLSERTLSRYRALLVPNAAYLADEPCRQIRAFVQAGGSLLATFETSRYDAWGDA